MRLDREVEARRWAVTELRHADRLCTVGRLTAGLAHDLATPLQVIAGRASLMISGGLLPEEVLESAAAMQRQSERMTHIVGDLMAFSRRGTDVDEMVELENLVQECLAMIRPIASERHVSVLAQTEGPCVTRGHAGELTQALTNLVVNAVHAMPHGGTVRVILRRVLDDPPSHREHAEIRVIDEGTGIAPDILPHIFEPFFTTKDVGQGTGLGLSVTFGIVRDHRGIIRVQTAPGRGSEFVVALPLEGSP